MAEESEKPKIHIDADWKAQAQKEKEQLAAKAKAAGAGKAPGAGTQAQAGAGGQRGLPPANFETLVSTMATQALYALGGIPDPQTGQAMFAPEIARHHIDMLSVIEEKTKGNLSEDEEKMLASTIYELRQRYIQLASRGGR